MQSNTGFRYSADLPYPPVKAEAKNLIYARAMLDNVGGSNSEMTAISLYMYNQLISEAYEELAQVFRNVSIVEMHHLEIFGGLARQLGEDPRLWTHMGRGKRYWSGGYNQYFTTVPQMLQYILKGEHAAIDKYSRQASAIRDANVVENLNRIIMDEQLHVDIFSQLLQKYGR